MAIKKSNSKKEPVQKEKSTLTKIAETIGTVAGEISVKKHQLTDIAVHAMDAIKSKIHDITAPDVAAVQQAAKDTIKKIPAKKALKPVEKKIPRPKLKKAIKNTVAVKQGLKKAAAKAVKKASGKK